MICFSWLGFPQYGARCVRAFVRSTKEKVVVLSSRPDVPIRGMEEIAECEIHWIPMDEKRSLVEILGDMPRVITIPGWKFGTFNRFRDEARAAGAKVICVSDNNFVFSLKECIKALLVRFRYSRMYDGFWVPSHSGAKQMRFYGVPEDKIITGLYSIDGSLFTGGEPLSKREKRILYVGRFNGRKNVLRMCEAFLSVDKEIRSGWKLEMCGCGELKEKLPKDRSILIHDFVQPEKLAGIYRNARAFMIASLEDHWPLVVHEASLSGCTLLLSERVGDKIDFLDEGVNGFSFNPTSIKEMRFAIENLMRMDDAQLDRAHRRSLELAGKITLNTFVDSVRKFT